MAAKSNLVAVYTVHAERMSGSDILHYDFQREAALREAERLIKREKREIRDSSTYKLVTSFADAYRFDTAKSAYERALLKHSTTEKIVADYEEITCLMRCRIEPDGKKYRFFYDDKELLTLGTPYPVNAADAPISLSNQVIADMARITRKLRSKRQHLTEREMKHVSASIAAFYDMRDENTCAVEVSGAYPSLLEKYSKMRIALLDKFFEDENSPPDAFSKLAAKVYVPFLDELMAHFEDYVVGTSEGEVYRLVTLLDHYKNHKTGDPFSGYELLPRAVRI